MTYVVRHSEKSNLTYLSRFKYFEHEEEPREYIRDLKIDAGLGRPIYNIRLYKEIDI